jgi:hypothetical protein
MNRAIHFLLLICTVLLTSSSFAWGQGRGTGLGIVLGEPTGLSFKKFIGPRAAIDAGLAWSLAHDNNFHVHMDYLLHDFRLLKNEFQVTEGQLPLYYGIGGILRVDDDSHFGVRFVIGTAYMFESAPVDLFFEVAPIMDLIPRTELTANAGIGFRYWFR